MSLTHESQLARVTQAVKRLQQEGFFGKLELDIQGGNVLRMVKTESIKLAESKNAKQGASQVRTEVGEAEVPAASSEQASQAG